MGRPNRILLAGYPHHILQRGHDRQPVFACDADFALYLANLDEQQALRGMRVHAYCLMTNHIHLLVEPRVDGNDISRLMKTLAARQTRYTNRIEGRTGTLWEDRFKCSLVDTDLYLEACIHYIEMNPVRAGLVKSPADYPWSSAAKPLRSTTPCSAQTGARAEHATEKPDPSDESVLTLIRTAIRRNQLLGNDRFRGAIEAKLGRRVSTRGPGRPRASSK